MKRRLATGLPSLAIGMLLLQAVLAAAESDNNSAYLLSFFKGNGEDGLHLASSTDGLKWSALNGNRSLLAPEVGRHKLMRDPSIVRGPDGTFHMVWTTSWTDNVIGYAHSEDLIHWSPQRTIGVMTHEPGCRNCWAPEVFYDAPSRRYVILWSTTIPGRFPDTAGSSESKYNHRIYGTTTTDFKKFTPTRLFFDPGYNVIDGFLARAGQKYLLFYKDERLHPTPRKVILMATGDRPDGPFDVPPEPITRQDWVEGPSAIQVGDTWFVYFDCYRRHRYGAVTSKDLKTWTDITEQLSFPPGTRHGTVFKVPPEILKGLQALEPEN